MSVWLDVEVAALAESLPEIPGRTAAERFDAMALPDWVWNRLAAAFPWHGPISLDLLAPPSTEDERQRELVSVAAFAELRERVIRAADGR